MGPVADIAGCNGLVAFALGVALVGMAMDCSAMDGVVEVPFGTVSVDMVLLLLLECASEPVEEWDKGYPLEGTMALGMAVGTGMELVGCVEVVGVSGRQAEAVVAWLVA